MKEKAERVPVYCPKCQTEWQPNATCCSGCGAQLSQRKVPPTPNRSGAKKEREIEYIEETIVHGNCTATVYRPILTAEERKIQEQATIAALTSIARSGRGFIKGEEEREEEE